MWNWLVIVSSGIIVVADWYRQFYYEGSSHCTHKQSGGTRIHAELVLDEFRQEGGEPCDEQTLAGPSEVQEEERRVGDEAAQSARQLSDLREGLGLAVPVSLGYFLRLQRRSPSTHRIP